MLQTKKLLIKIVPFAFFLLAGLGLRPSGAFAAAPGCYQNTSGNYTSVSCPTVDLSKQVGQEDLCFVTTARTIDASTSFTQTPCASFNAAGSEQLTDDVKEVKNDCNGDSIKAGLAPSDENHCGILNYLQLFMQVLSALAGVVIAGSIIVAGIQYSTAAGDPSKTAAAKKRISMALLALFVYLFFFAMLQWLVPGGII